MKSGQNCPDRENYILLSGGTMPKSKIIIKTPAESINTGINNMLNNNKNTKQEKYDKKMAKYLANRARKVQKENEKRANRPGSTPMKARLMKAARDYFKSGKCFNIIEVSENGKDYALGVMTWGPNAICSSAQTIYLGVDDNSEIENIWEKCVETAFDEHMMKQINKGYIHINYIIANNPEEAWSQIKIAMMSSKIA